MQNNSITINESVEPSVGSVDPFTTWLSYCGNIIYPVNTEIDITELLRPYLSVARGKKYRLDFNKIIGPAPRFLNFPMAAFPLDSERLYSSIWKFDIIPLGYSWEAEKKCQANFKKYGYECADEWRINNWGTKSNAYSLILPEKTDEGHWKKMYKGAPYITFYTEWHSPKPIIRKLAVLTKTDLSFYAREMHMLFEEHMTVYADGRTPDYVYRKLPLSGIKTEMPGAN